MTNIENSTVCGAASEITPSWTAAVSDEASNNSESNALSIPPENYETRQLAGKTGKHPMQSVKMVTQVEELNQRAQEMPDHLQETSCPTDPGNVETSCGDLDEAVNKALNAVKKEARMSNVAKEAAIRNEVPNTETNPQTGTFSEEVINSDEREQLNEWLM